MIVSRCRDIEEFKKVHAQCDNGEFVGCIYLEDDEGRVC